MYIYNVSKKVMSQYKMWAIGLKSVNNTLLGLIPQYIERYKNWCSSTQDVQY